jgi:transposase
VARARPQTAEAGHPQTQQGPRVRRQGRRHRRVVSGPARRRGRTQPGRETQIQALDRTQPPLPIEFDRSEQRTHDYVRHGTTNLFAALNVGTGEIVGDCVPSRNGAAFLAFLKKAVAPHAGREIHVVLDNLSTHTTPDVNAWLHANPNVHFHFTPTGSSRLNQIETWFGIITRQAIRRGTFASMQVLIRTIRAYIASWNTNPRPFTWTATADEIPAKVRLTQPNIKKLVANNTK